MYSGCLTYIAITTTDLERPMYMAGVAVVWLVTNTPNLRCSIAEPFL